MKLLLWPFVSASVAIVLVVSALAQAPVPPPTPAPSPVPTIGDVIGALVKAETDLAQATAAAKSAQEALTNATAAQAQASAALKTGLAAVGPVFVQNQDGGVEVYIPDTSEAGYHVITPLPVTSPVPSPTPTPTPAPTPSPTPVPAQATGSPASTAGPGVLHLPRTPAVQAPRHPWPGPASK